MFIFPHARPFEDLLTPHSHCRLATTLNICIYHNAKFGHIFIQASFVNHHILIILDENEHMHPLGLVSADHGKQRMELHSKHGDDRHGIPLCDSLQSQYQYTHRINLSHLYQSAYNCLPQSEGRNSGVRKPSLGCARLNQPQAKCTNFLISPEFETRETLDLLQGMLN
jgi:hypothetical protein